MRSILLLSLFLVGCENTTPNINRETEKEILKCNRYFVPYGDVYVCVIEGQKCFLFNSGNRGGISCNESNN